MIEGGVPLDPYDHTLAVRDNATNHPYWQLTEVDNAGLRKGSVNMLIGDSERFAIEFEVDEEKLADVQLSEWLFGRIRFWCCGQQVGRYENDTTIRDVAIESERLLMNEGKRRDETLASLSAVEVTRIILQALYVNHGQSDEQVRLDNERFGRLVVTPQVDVFDEWRMFLVEAERGGRLIWQRKTDEVVRECALREGEFDQVLKEFLAALRNCASVAMQ